MHCLNCHEFVLHQVTWSNLFLPAKKESVCEQCHGKWEKIKGPVCWSCCRPMERTGICYDCKRWEENEEWEGVLEKNRSIFHYNEAMKDVMARWKYRGDYVLVDMFKEAYAEEFHHHFSRQDIVVVPIPLSDERLEERGFNQAEALAEILQTPIKHVLSRVHTEKQSKKNRRERVATVNPFQLNEPVLKPVLLVDDIYTTGITLRHAAKLLKAGGSPEVSSLTLVRS